MGFKGEAIITLFDKIQEEGTDLVRGQVSASVKEYTELLMEYLDSCNWHLILMADAEIKGYYASRYSEEYFYCASEVNKYFVQNDKRYPLELITLHTDILTFLFISGAKKESGLYLRRLRQIQEIILGKDSFLFCRNWCFILVEFVSEYCEDIAIKEYEYFRELFVHVLLGEKVLYQIHLRLASIKMKKENEAGHLRQAVEQCQIWMDSSDKIVSPKIRSLVFGMKGMYYRITGDIESAVSNFGKAIDCADDLNDKLNWIVQKGTMFYVKQDIKGLWECVCQGMGEIQKPDEENAVYAEIYNLYGLYFMLVQEFAIASEYFRKAEVLGKCYLGEFAEATVKFRANFLLAQYHDGNVEESREQMIKLLEQMSNSPEIYPEIYAVVQNNVLAVSLANYIDSNYCRRMKRVLKCNVNAYDLSASILYKSNLYFCLVILENIDKNTKDDLETELNKYFSSNPYGIGYIQYLKGRVYRCCLQGQEDAGYRILEILREYLGQVSFTDITSEYGILYFNISLRILLYKQNFEGAYEWLVQTGDKYLKQLFRRFLDNSKDNMRSTYSLVQMYISTFISTVFDYPEIGISVDELYGFVLKYKYLLNLFCCNKEQIGPVDICTFERADLKIGKGDLLFECFEYTRFDMRSELTVMGPVKIDLENDIFQICFGIKRDEQDEKKYKAEILYNKSIEKIWEGCSTEFDAITDYEKNICDFLCSRIDGKDTIYVAADCELLPMPMAAVRVSENTYIGELFQIIYCSSGYNAGEDVVVEDFENSIFLGVSEFESPYSEQKGHLGKYMSSLPYTQMETEYAAQITNGKTPKAEYKKVLSAGGAEIIHLATHTMQDDVTGEKMLVIGNGWKNGTDILKCSDVAKMNWKNVQLVVLSGCETGKGIGDSSLRQAIKKAGAAASITTFAEVYDDVNMFFMFWFYKYLVKYKKIGLALFMAQRTMRNITKREMVMYSDFEEFDMEYYLKEFGNNDKPFSNEFFWAGYIYQIN